MIKMANDIDMWNDIEAYEKHGEFEISNRLLECFNAKFNEGNNHLAELLKKQFKELFGFWGNYY
jgi:hypothetical protein